MWYLIVLIRDLAFLFTLNLIFMKTSKSPITHTIRNESSNFIKQNSVGIVTKCKTRNIHKNICMRKMS